MIRVIDFEATGTEPDAAIVEVGWCDFLPASRTIAGRGSYLCRVDAMPPQTRAIHHIRVADTAGCAPYDRRCLYEDAMRAGAVALAAHSADFEGRHIIGSLPLVCTYKAALRVWPDAPAHGVFPLLYWLEDQGTVEFDREAAMPPHRAGPDAYATAVLLQAIYMAGYEGSDLVRWTREPAFMTRCPIGAWRGHLWEEVETSMLEWIMWKARDLGEDVRWNAQREYDRRTYGDE